MSGNYWRYYGIAAVVLLSMNLLFYMVGLPRFGGIGTIFFVAAVVMAIQEWRSAGGKRDTAVQDARERDQSWTEADKQAFKEAMNKQLRR